MRTAVALLLLALAPVCFARSTQQARPAPCVFCNLAQPSWWQAACLGMIHHVRGSFTVLTLHRVLEQASVGWETKVGGSSFAVCVRAIAAHPALSSPSVPLPSPFRM